MKQLQRLELRDLPESFQLEITDTPVQGEISAIIHLTPVLNPSPNSVYIWHNCPNGELKRSKVNILNSKYEPLQYPLIYFDGTKGWGINEQSKGITMRTHVQRLILQNDLRWRALGHLSSEWSVDMFCRIETNRLDYQRSGQKNSDRGEQEAEHVRIGRLFINSRSWAREQVSDCSALSAKKGRPSFFITMTCNPSWPEIVEALLPGQNYTHIPGIVVRVFYRRLQALKKFLK
jgi:hypothetical protein